MVLLLTGYQCFLCLSFEHLKFGEDGCGRMKKIGKQIIWVDLTKIRTKVWHTHRNIELRSVLILLQKNLVDFCWENSLKPESNDRETPLTFTQI